MEKTEIRKMIVSPKTSVKEAMKGISGISSRVLFVVDDSERLIGSITDGDIRRAILSNIGFERPIEEIMFKSPRFVRNDEKDFEEKAKAYIFEAKLHAIPVLDRADRIVDIMAWYVFFEKHPRESHVFKPVTNYVVIMAGGKGERLDPFTKILPKPLIPFGNKPLIEKIMDNFNRGGFVNFLLTLNYKKELIKMYLRENYFPYSIEWVEEVDYLGTAGGLKLLRDKFKDTFFVCNCDIILEADFGDILLWHKGEKAALTLIGCHKEMTIPYGTLELNNGLLKKINEKPAFDLVINTGVYVIEPKVISLIESGMKIDMNELIEKVLEKGWKVTVYPVCGGWFDIGQWKEYKESLCLLNGEG